MGERRTQRGGKNGGRSARTHTRPFEGTADKSVGKASVNLPAGDEGGGLLGAPPPPPPPPLGVAEPDILSSEFLSTHTHKL